SLSTLDAVVMIVGLVLGVGIFRAPQLVAANSGSGTMFIGLWLLGGLISLIGALCYAEIATAYPNTGGEYHFLSRAFGRPVGFLFAWSRMTVLQTGSLAILAFVFGDFAAPLLPFGAGASPFLAATTVVALTAVNLAGLRQARGTQYVLTAAVVVGLLAVILAGMVVAGRADTEAGEAISTGVPTIGLAMVFVLLTFGGWSEAAYLSAEVRDGRRGISRALLWGIGSITLLYVAANLAYLWGLGVGGIAASETVAADLVSSVVGDWGGVVISLFVLVAALSSANATIITGARSNYALGRDWGLFAWMGTWRDKDSAPTYALLVQGGIALVLVAFGAMARGGFEAMVAYTAPVFWTVLLLTGIAVMVLRRREPGTTRPFRVPLYPVTPVLFCATSAFMLYSSVSYAGSGAWLGVAVMLAGVPLLWIAQPRPYASVGTR
ncbi:MAG: amino acid permease, partial [Gemmatimonadota bacterium]|nr:amino acid permease [Gemmatimonadota bacterium]